MQRKWKRRWQRAIIKMIAVPIIATGLLLSAYSPALANPSGATVTTGAANIATSGNKMTITTSDQVAINWQNYNIAKGETVQYIQPSVNSVALNRVTGNDASAIYGTLAANGKVFLINSNGVLFAPGSAVNVGSLVASTRNITDSDFIAGKNTFSGDSNAAIVNQGTITASTGGYVALLGAQAQNTGFIVANQGTVALAGGNAVTLDMAGDGFLNLVVDQSALKASVANSGVIQADGGKVYMSARTADALAGTVVNNSGKIQAQSMTSKNGVIILDGGTTGTVSVSGTLDASGQKAGQTGGTIKVLGNTLTTAGASLNASGDAGGGTILIGGDSHGQGTDQNAITTTIDQSTTINASAITNGNGGNVTVWSDGTTNFAGTITAKGGSVSGNGGSVETSGHTLTEIGSVNAGATNGKNGSWLLDPTDLTITDASGIDNSLNSNTNVDEAASGNITVATPIAWSGTGNLTLSAGENIYINAPITSSGSGGLIMTYGSGDGYYLASGAAINLSTSGSLNIESHYYTIVDDLTTLATDISNNSGSGYYALGGSINVSGTTYTSSPISTALSGTFDGLGHTISNLTINSSATNVGLFSQTNSESSIRNVGLVGVSITGTCVQSNVGGLVGSNAGTVTNCYSTGVVSDNSNYGEENIGGLVGYNSGTVTNCYSTGAVSDNSGQDGGYGGEDRIGGLVGANSGTVTNCYSTGAVTDNSIENPFAFGTSGDSLGGLVGYNTGTVTNCYSTGAVSDNSALGDNSSSGGDYIGGLVGHNSGTATNCYSTGTVSHESSDYFSGLYGWSSTTPTNSFWNTNDQIISGTISGATAGDTVYAAVGTSANSISVYDSTGFFYIPFVANNLSGSNNILLAAKTGGGTVYSSSYYSGTVLTGLNMTANTLTFLGGTISNSELAAAEGDVTATFSPLYTVSSNDLTVSGNLMTAYGTTYSPGGNVTTSGAQQYNGAITIGTNTLSFAGTSLSASGPITTSGSGCWLAYAPNLAAISGTFLRNYNFSQYGSTISSQISTSASGNGLILAAPLTFTQSLTSTVTKIYDGTTSVSNLTSANYQIGTISGFTALIASVPTTGNYSDQNVNSISSPLLVTASAAPTITVTDSNEKPVYGYGFSTVTASGNIGSITPIQLALTAGATVTKVYNGANTATLSTGNFTTGVLPTDAQAVTISGSGTYDSADVNAASVTVGTLNLEGTKASDYQIASAPTTLNGSITPIQLALTAGATVTKVYNGANTATLSTGNFTTGVLPTDAQAVTISGSGTYNSADVNAANTVIVGSVSLSGTKASDYTLSGVPATLSGTITPAALDITANSVSKTYGQAVNFNNVTGFTTNGLQNSETVGSVTLTSAGSDPTASVASYTISDSAAVGGTFNPNNYNVNYISGKLTVSPASLTITANNATITYNGRAYSGGNGVTYSGLANGETSADLLGVLTYSGTSQGAVIPKTYIITPGGLISGNYAINYENGTLTINQPLYGYYGALATAEHSNFGGINAQIMGGGDSLINIIGLGVDAAGNQDFNPGSDINKQNQ